MCGHWPWTTGVVIDLLCTYWTAVWLLNWQKGKQSNKDSMCNCLNGFIKSDSYKSNRSVWQQPRPQGFSLKKKKALGTRLVWQRTLTDVLIFCGLRHLHSMYLFKSLLISWLSWHVRKWSKEVRGWFERPLRCMRSKLDPGDIVSTSLLSV